MTINEIDYAIMDYESFRELENIKIGINDMSERYRKSVLVEELQKRLN